MRKFLALLSAILFTTSPFFAEVASAAENSKDDDRLKNCGLVLKEVLDVPDNIPQGLLDKADCIVVFPSVVKAAFIVGGSYGRGAMSCRQGENFRGGWGAPTMMALEGGSFGFQIGGQATDFVLLVMNESGARPRRKIWKYLLSVLVGGLLLLPVAAWYMTTDSFQLWVRHRLIYSRARGLFAGVSLEGSTIRPDNGDNQRVYGKKISAREIVLSGNVAAPAAAEQFLSTLDEKTPKHGA